MSGLQTSLMQELFLILSLVPVFSRVPGNPLSLTSASFQTVLPTRFWEHVAHIATKKFSRQGIYTFLKFPLTPGHPQPPARACSLPQGEQQGHPRAARVQADSPGHFQRPIPNKEQSRTGAGGASCPRPRGFQRLPIKQRVLWALVTDSWRREANGVSVLQSRALPARAAHVCPPATSTRKDTENLSKGDTAAPGEMAQFCTGRFYSKTPFCKNFKVAKKVPFIYVFILKRSYVRGEKECLF